MNDREKALEALKVYNIAGKPATVDELIAEYGENGKVEIRLKNLKIAVDALSRPTFEDAVKGEMTLTPKQIETLERLGFQHREPMFVGWYGYWVKGYGADAARGEIIVHENGGFNVRYHSSVQKEIEKDLVELRKEGIE